MTPVPFDVAIDGALALPTPQELRQSLGTIPVINNPHLHPQLSYSPASYFHLHLTLLSTTLTQRRDGVFKCSQSLTQFKKPRSTV